MAARLSAEARESRVVDPLVAFDSRWAHPARPGEGSQGAVETSESCCWYRGPSAGLEAAGLRAVSASQRTQEGKNTRPELPRPQVRPRK